MEKCSHESQVRNSQYFGARLERSWVFSDLARWTRPHQRIDILDRGTEPTDMTSGPVLNQQAFWQPFRICTTTWSASIKLPSGNIEGKLEVTQKKFPCGQLALIWPLLLQENQKWA